MRVLRWKWRQVEELAEGLESSGRTRTEPLSGQRLSPSLEEELMLGVPRVGSYLGDRVKLMRVSLVEISGV